MPLWRFSTIAVNVNAANERAKLLYIKKRQIQILFKNNDLLAYFTQDLYCFVLLCSSTRTTTDACSFGRPFHMYCAIYVSLIYLGHQLSKSCLP